MISIEVNTFSDIQNRENTTNTIFYIIAEIDMLNPVDPISFGEGCSIVFRGGKLKNGKINGDKMTIVGASFGVLDNVVLLGTYTNTECDLSWWGCVPYTNNNPADNAAKITNALRSSIIRITVNAKYGISSPVDIGHNTHVIVGNSQMEYKRNGFIANPNFSGGSTITLENEEHNLITYTIRGMFYYYYDQHPTMENICIDADKKADYALEHIAGYASVDLRNIYIYGARIAGILQYGCEHLRWDHVYVLECGIGIFISNKRIVYTYGQSQDTKQIVETGYDIFANGDFVSMNNMLNLTSCRVLRCNYGFVIKDGTNTSLINCESAYNSIFGLYTYGSTQVITNYYSEGDGYCNFWRKNNGATCRPDDDSLTYSGLITDNRDGVSPIDINGDADTNNCFNHELYLRAPLYFDQSLVTIHGLYTSVHPRSTTIDNATTFLLPTQRDYAGVDAVIIAKAGKVTVEGHSIYLLSSNCETLAMPFKTYIAMSASPNTKPAIFDIRSFKTNKHKVNVWYANNSSYEPNYFSALVGESAQMTPSFVAGIIRRDYNKMGGAVYGPLESRYDLRDYATFREFHNGVPLFQLSEISKLRRYFTPGEVTAKFGDVTQVRLRLVMRVIEDQTMQFNIQARMEDSSYDLIYLSGQTCSGVGTIAAGYYDIYMRLDLKYAIPTWHHLVLTMNCPVLPSKVYFSDFLFYDNEDGPNLPVPSYDTYSLQGGYTGQRPSPPRIGQTFYDTLLGKLIVFNGTEWVFPDGSAIPGEA